RGATPLAAVRFTDVRAARTASSGAAANPAPDAALSARRPEWGYGCVLPARSGSECIVVTTDGDPPLCFSASTAFRLFRACARPSRRPFPSEVASCPWLD